MKSRGPAPLSNSYISKSRPRFSKFKKDKEQMSLIEELNMEVQQKRNLQKY